MPPKKTMKAMKATMAPKAMKTMMKAPKSIKTMKAATAKEKSNDITKCPDKSLRNRVHNAMARTLSTDQRVSYSKCANDKKRQQWVAEYILDPKKVKCQGATSVSRNSATTDKEVTIWITEAELGGPSYLNNTGHAALAITTLVNRPHEIGALAAAGVKQYQWTIKQHVLGKAITEAATIGSSAEMSAEQGQMLRGHMSNSGNPGAMQ